MKSVAAFLGSGVGLLMMRTSNRDTDRDFENAVMQAIVE
jgi:hypothetical protein